MPVFTPKWTTPDGQEWDSEAEATAHEVLLITKKQIQLYLASFNFRPNKRTEYETIITKWEEFKYQLEHNGNSAVDDGETRDTVQSIV
jgi:hypothetical protein